MTYGAVILAGGQSRRMGTDKAALPFGSETFLERVARELSDFDEKLLSVSDESIYTKLPSFQTVIDIYKDCGPMGGLFTAMTACQSDVLLAVSCDLPLFQKEFGEYLISQMDENCDALIPRTTDSRFHPLCAVYRKSCAAVFENCLQNGDYRLCSAMGKINTKYIYPVEFEPCLQNINTPLQYKSLFESDTALTTHDGKSLALHNMQL